MHEMYSKNIVPTTASLKARLHEKEVPIEYSEEYFRQYLRSIGFLYKTLNKRASIMETQRLKRMRWDYILQIRKYREEKRNIVYLDETWYDTHDVVSKGLVTDEINKCILNTPPARGKRVIILHAGGKDGWVCNGLLLSAKNIKNCSADYHQDMNSNLFETWFENQLLPNLPPNTVIVMDNASYHSRKLSPKPTKQNRKEIIIEYMKNHNIPIPPEKTTKEKLLQIIKDCDLPNYYVVDELAKKKGHAVLRLPPYYCILNPIELIWSVLKRSVRKHNNTPTLSAKVIDLVRQEADNITKELWQKCVKHVIEIENSYVSPNIQRFVIEVDEEDDDSFSYSEDEVTDCEN
jgi:transposase